MAAKPYPWLWGEPNCSLGMALYNAAMRPLTHRQPAFEAFRLMARTAQTIGVEPEYYLKELRSFGQARMNEPWWKVVGDWWLQRGTAAYYKTRVGYGAALPQGAAGFYAIGADGTTKLPWDQPVNAPPMTLQQAFQQVGL